MSDWIKLHRQALDSQVFSDPILWRVFCWCLMRANWKKGWFGGKEIQPGSFATGKEAGSQQLGMTPSSWYRHIKKLEKLGIISVEANNRFTVISVVKWSFFQNCEQQMDNGWTTSEQRMDNQRTTNEQQMDTIEEGKKEKKERREENLPTYKADDFQKQSIDPKLLPHWERWCNWSFARTGIKMDQIRADAMLMDLERRGIDKAIKDIEYTIVSGYDKKILDSDDDYSKQRAAQRQSRGGPKCKGRTTEQLLEEAFGPRQPEVKNERE